jgi:hypothetical protein
MGFQGWGKKGKEGRDNKTRHETHRRDETKVEGTSGRNKPWNDGRHSPVDMVQMR